MNKAKEAGQVFTPAYLVRDILDTAGYTGDMCLHRHIIDNSCGNGAFLCEVVRRYCTAFLRHSSDTVMLKEELQVYVHGIEIDTAAYQECLLNLDDVVAPFGISGIRWDVLNEDTLRTSKYDGKMDFVVGNPPYVRVHNLHDTYTAVKTFRFAKGGMTDLYLVFFEVGFRMLASNGKLCYITPSSWLNSVAGKYLREFIWEERTLLRLIDLEHFQAFQATTYTLISLFQKGVRTEAFLYGQYLGEEHIVKYVESISFEDAFISGEIYLADRATLRLLRDIISYDKVRHVSVKNGFATLADNVFISQTFPFEEFVIPVIKASTGKWFKAFYPYDKSGRPLPKETITAVPAVANYLEACKDLLLKGRKEVNAPDWYLYGRTQALLDVSKKKFAVNTCIRDSSSVKLNFVSEGQGVYSGLYILTDVSFDEIRSILVSDDFIRYVSLLKKYKSGGYYTFNSKELECFLNYNIAKNRGHDTRQRDLFTSNI